MLLFKNPSEERIQWLIQQSDMQAAKWLKDTEDGQLYYWPANWKTHAQIADELLIKDYDKGIVT